MGPYNLKKYYIGYDIGAISVNRAIIDEDKNVIEVMPYTRHFGEPVKVILKDIEHINSMEWCGQSGGTLQKDKEDKNSSCKK